MKLRPLADQLIVKIIDLKPVTAAGIIIPDHLVRERPQQGTIIAAGPGWYTKTGTLVPLSVKPGDSVMFGKFVGIELSVEGTTYLVLKESDLIAVVEKGKFAEVPEPTFEVFEGGYTDDTH